MIYNYPAMHQISISASVVVQSWQTRTRWPTILSRKDRVMNHFTDNEVANSLAVNMIQREIYTSFCYYQTISTGWGNTPYKTTHPTPRSAKQIHNVSDNYINWNVAKWVRSVTVTELLHLDLWQSHIRGNYNRVWPTSWWCQYQIISFIFVCIQSPEEHKKRQEIQLDQIIARIKHDKTSILI